MRELAQQLASGHLSPLTVLIWTVVALLLSMAGGAMAGVKLAGKDLGNELAAMMGAMLGPAAALPGIFLGLIILVLL